MNSGTDVCQKVITSYMKSVGEQWNVVESSEDTCYLVSPFSRPDGELIEIEVSVFPDGRIRISDMGDTLGYLHINGLAVSRATVDSARRLARRLAVSLERYELEVFALDIEGVGERLHALLQAIINVNDLILRRRPIENLQFDTEVEAFLVGQRVIYDSDYQVKGETEPHRVRFHVDSTKKILIQPLSAASESAAWSWAERWAYRFGDIKQSDPKWNTFAVLDNRGDRQAIWTPKATLPLTGFARVIPWTENTLLAQELAS